MNPVRFCVGTEVCRGSVDRTTDAQGNKQRSCLIQFSAVNSKLLDPVQLQVSRLL